MLAGIVRAIEVALVAIIGFVLYFCYVVPARRLGRYYIGAIIGISLALDAGVPGRRYLSGAGLPRS